MHLVFLGVMRRLLYYWIGHPGCPKSCKLIARYVRQLSEQLVSLWKNIPSEFSRKPRALSELDRWKATEFQQILLYTGCVVFRNVVSDAVYKNFLLLHVAMRCLTDVSATRLNGPHIYCALMT